MPEYNKLVRDRIPEIIEREGKKAIIHTAEEKEYVDSLAAKLREEVDEFLVDPSAEEAADILEAIYAICEFRKIDLSKLEEIRKEKASKRGGFGNRTILERTE